MKHNAFVESIVDGVIDFLEFLRDELDVAIAYLKRNRDAIVRVGSTIVWYCKREKVYFYHTY